MLTLPEHRLPHPVSVVIPGVALFCLCVVLLVLFICFCTWIVPLFEYLFKTRYCVILCTLNWITVYEAKLKFIFSELKYTYIDNIKTKTNTHAIMKKTSPGKNEIDHLYTPP